MTAPTPNAPAGAVNCPDCGNALRHVAGEDWACSRCKDPQTQSGQRYWRVVAPAEQSSYELLKAAILDHLDAFVHPGEEAEEYILVCAIEDAAAALLAARREVDATRDLAAQAADALDKFWPDTPVQSRLRYVAFDLVQKIRAALAATPEEKND